VRATLKVPPTQLTDRDLDSFIKALDDDGSGDLDIAELSDFVLRGSATFNDNHKGDEDDDEKGHTETAHSTGLWATKRSEVGERQGHEDYPNTRTVRYEDELEGLELEDREIRNHITSIYLNEEKRLKDSQEVQQHQSDHDEVPSGTSQLQQLFKPANPMRRNSSIFSVVQAQSSAKKIKKAKVKIDEAISKKVQSKLKAGMYGTTPTTFFRRYDKDKSGSLDIKEFKRLVRATLKVPPTQLTDRDLDSFIKALDDDGSGDLDIAELSDFVLRGSATFNDKHKGDEEDDEESIDVEAEEARIGRMREARRKSKAGVGTERFNILGEVHQMDDKEMTVPVPFVSMEMDVLLRRHKVDERERKLYLDVEEQKLEMRRRAKKATTAEANAAHLRLSQNTAVLKQRREQAAAEAEMEEMKRNQFKAVRYQPKEFEDWSSMAENAEVERSKRRAKRYEEIAASMKPPKMLTREEAAKKEHTKLERPNSITEPETKSKRYRDPKEVRASLEKSQQNWDKVMAKKREDIARERAARDAPQNPLAQSEQESAARSKLRQQRKQEKELEAQRCAREEEEMKFERAMKAPVPDRVKQTRASSLKVETVRSAQLQLEQQAKREVARAEARARRSQEAGEELKPYLTTNRDRGHVQDNSEGREVGARTKARQSRIELEEKVKAKRPSLMQRHDLLTAKDRARASTLRKVGGALRTVYGGGDGWLAAAMQDDVLDAEEVEFLRLANPTATTTAAGGYSDDDDEY